MFILRQVCILFYDVMLNVIKSNKCRREDYAMRMKGTDNVKHEQATGKYILQLLMHLDT